MTSYGKNICVTLFGGSHDAEIGLVASGLPSGMKIDEKSLAEFLSRRAPGHSDLSTPRKEEDAPVFLSGVKNGETDGNELRVIIKNTNTRSSDYDSTVPRPSHADYPAYVKSNGKADLAGGGHFSGRVTAALVALGGILLPALEKKGITIGTHILKCAEVKDSFFRDPEKEIPQLRDREFPVLDIEKGREMTEKIRQAAEAGDSVGGVTQTAVCGLDAGLGEPWFDSVEGLLSHALFSLGGIKGVEFGLGFSFPYYRGSQCNDPLMMMDGKIVTETNNNGGINGGITNGMPILFQCAVKPTPSISMPQYSVDMDAMEDRKIQIVGRHDPAIVRRICPVIDSVTAMVLCDLMAQRFGTDILK
mgnify:CR=1 FL=1